MPSASTATNICCSTANCCWCWFMLELRNVVHNYPGTSRAALQGIDLQLQVGECLGLLGSNGAGKTTLLSLLSGVLALQQGELRWEGQPRLGLVPQQLAFYAGLKVGENLELFADLYRLRGAERRQRLQQCIDICALEDKLTRRSEQLSGGEQRRLNFAIGLLQPAGLYLFDEATLGVHAPGRPAHSAAARRPGAPGSGQTPAARRRPRPAAGMAGRCAHRSERTARTPATERRSAAQGSAYRSTEWPAAAGHYRICRRPGWPAQPAALRPAFARAALPAP